MSLVVAALQADILAALLAMNTIEEGGNEYQADKMARAIKKYILAGQTSTTDLGAAPAGAYSGTGAGVMTIDDSKLKDDLFATFEAGYGDDDLADHMAADIDNVCKADNTVTETSKGKVTTSSGAAVDFSGPAIGKFSGSKALISTSLKACFKAMIGMMEGGNQLYAAQLSAAIDAYMKAGTISVTLKVPPFASGAGTGKIA
jgi:hypothetical protein